MTIFYKFKNARDYDTISMDGPLISVGFLKKNIYEAMHLGGRRSDLDLVISNARTKEDYLDEAMLIPKNTSVLIRWVPRHPRIRTITQQEPPRVEEKVENVQTADALAAEADEETKLKALIDTPALDCQNFGPGRDYGLGMAGMMGGRYFGIERKTPYAGYICHRCNVPGHFTQHCPTNGDPSYNVKPHIGIPNPMLMGTPDVTSSLPNGANADAFEREMEGLPSTTRILESSNSSAEIAGSRFQVEDMPMGPGPSSQYFNGVQPGFNDAQPGFHYGSHAFTAPFPGVVPPFFGYGIPPMDMSFSSVMHPYSFAAQGFGFPNNIPPPHRDLAEMGNGMNLQCPTMGEEESEARKAEMRENERRGNVMREGESYPASSSSKRQHNRRRRPERFSPERQSSRRFNTPPRSSSSRFQHDRRHQTHDSERYHRRNRWERHSSADDEDSHFKSKRSRR